MNESKPHDAAANVAKLISQDFYFGRLDLSERDVAPDFDAWQRMPEVACVERLRSTGIGLPEIRLFITFIAAMDRARDANRLWNQGVKLFTHHPELFQPQHVARLPIGDLRDLLAKYGVSQRHNQDSSAWSTISKSLLDNKNPVAEAIYHGRGDAQELLRGLQTRSGGETKFPLLRGPKIGPMWVRMLVAPGEAGIENIDTVPVAVDVHVERATKNLIPLVQRDRKSIQHAWHEAVRNAEIVGPKGLANTCAALDPALWTLGKYGCTHCETKNRAIPISAACDDCALMKSQ